MQTSLAATKVLNSKAVRAMFALIGLVAQITITFLGIFYATAAILFVPSSLLAPTLPNLFYWISWIIVLVLGIFSIKLAIRITRGDARIVKNIVSMILTNALTWIALYILLEMITPYATP